MRIADPHPSHKFVEGACEYCGLADTSYYGVFVCPAYTEAQEASEKAEYQRMLAERRRFEELHAKYGT